MEDGRKTYSKDPAAYVTVVNDPLGSFHRQHDVRLLPDGDIGMFDDETQMPGPARAVIYSYDLSTRTASVVWQHFGIGDSTGNGELSHPAGRIAHHRVGDDEGPARRRVFTEVNEAGDDLLDFYFPKGDASYRAIKIPTSAFDLSVFRRTMSSP